MVRSVAPVPTKRFERRDSLTRERLAPSEALNALTVGAASVDLAPAGWAPRPGEVAIQDDGEPSPAISTGHGPRPFGAIKPDLLAYGGRHDVRMIAAGDSLRLRVMRETGRSGVFVAAARAGPGELERARGTSCAAALTTRVVLNAAAELTGEDGPFAGQELPRRDIALLTRALAVNASRWPDAAHARYREELLRLGKDRHFQAKEEVARQFGRGVLDADLMREAPGFGATLVGIGTVRKDAAQVFDVPLPPSMSGDSVHRAIHVTLASLGALLEPAQRRRTRQRPVTLTRGLNHQIVTKGIVIVQIFVPQCDRVHALTHHRRHIVKNLPALALITERTRDRHRQPHPPVNLAQ